MSSRLKCSAQVSRCRCCEGSTGRGVAIFAFGTLLQRAKQPAARLDATLVNMRFVKPLDGDLILSLLAQHDRNHPGNTHAPALDTLPDANLVISGCGRPAASDAAAVPRCDAWAASAVA